nr:dehydrogenase [Klebsiella michiganensis]
MGSGIGSLSVSQRLTSAGEMLQAAVTDGFTIATTPQIATAWPQDNRQKRTIFIVD